jgi:hypothetical protein
MFSRLSGEKAGPRAGTTANAARMRESRGEELRVEMRMGLLEGRPQTAEEIASAALFLVSD